MFQVNDYVVYGSTGVCKLVDICQENFGGRNSREYYVLSPVYGNQMDIFIPTDKEDAPLRPILSRQQVMALIHSMPAVKSEWIADDSYRKAIFGEIIQSGELDRIIQLIKIIFDRKVELEHSGKRLGNTETELLKQAEKILHHEFAFALDLEPDQVLPFIQKQF